MMELGIGLISLNGFVKVCVSILKFTLVQQHVTQVEVVVRVLIILRNCKVKVFLGFIHFVLMVKSKALVLIVK